MMSKKKQMVTSKTQKKREPLLEDDWLMVESEPAPLTLRFSPTAWAKLLYTDADDLLFVKEFVTVKQEVTCVSVNFDDNAVGEFFDAQVDLGRKPEQFARIWLHSHPGDSLEPSVVDEETFDRVFGKCQWAAMVIVAQDSSTYARLSFNVGPGGQVLVPTAVDYSQPFGATDHEAWEDEYAANVTALDWLSIAPANEAQRKEGKSQACALPYDLLSEFEDMDPAQRQLVLDELAERPELWDDEREVLCL